MRLPTPLLSGGRQSELDDPDVFARKCEEARARLWRVVASAAGRAEADDLAQEAVTRAYAARRTYRGDAPFAAWLCRIALNCAHDHRRSAWARRVTPLDEGLAFAAEAPSAEAEAEVRLARRRVRAAVLGLPAPLRDPIWLHYFEQIPVAEIARTVGAPDSTIRSRIKKGLRRLATLLAEVDPDPSSPPCGAVELR